MLIAAECFALEIYAHGPRKRVGHNKRRRSQPIGAHLLVHAPFKVAVAGEHRGNHEIAFSNRARNMLGQRSGIADAGGAAVADKVKAERVEIGLQPGFFQVFGNHFRARRKRSLDPGLHHQATLGGLSRDQARAKHHCRIGGVGARGDRRDHHIAMPKIIVRPLDRQTTV